MFLPRSAWSPGNVHSCRDLGFMLMIRLLQKTFGELNVRFGGFELSFILKRAKIVQRSFENDLLPGKFFLVLLHLDRGIPCLKTRNSA